MLRPPPAAIITGAATWVVMSIDRTLTAIIWSHSATLISRIGVLPKIPALLTRSQTPPSSVIASAIADRVASGSARSTVTPVAPSSAATSRTVGSMSRRASFEPSATRRSAIARPMPRAAPVTIVGAFAGRVTALADVSPDPEGWG